MRMAGKPFFGCQRGKRDSRSTVKTPEGRELALELVRAGRHRAPQHDQGRRRKLGIGYETCKAVNPDVVYCNT